MRSLELRRHARRDPQADRLSPQGRAEAEDLGRSMTGSYAIAFVSPAQRAAETLAWMLRGMGAPLPPHEVVPGLGGEGEGGTEAGPLAGVVRSLIAQVPDGERGLAVGHTPLIERAVLGLTGTKVEPLAECEGVLITEEEGSLSVDELRLR